jgi:acyl-CoA synthetase (AMP-forming)/AMP-acid ligase II
VNRFDVIGTDDDVVWPDLAAETLIEFCRDHLASFKKPKRIEFLAELPKNLRQGASSNTARRLRLETILTTT